MGASSKASTKLPPIPGLRLRYAAAAAPRARRGGLASTRGVFCRNEPPDSMAPAARYTSSGIALISTFLDILVGVVDNGLGTWRRRVG
eukprot:722626-Amorphochlora_amoeboformis.AAC.1